MNLEQSNLYFDTEKEPTCFRLEVQSTGSSFSWERIVDSDDRREDRYRRIIGAMLMVGMPVEGLSEALDTLADIYEFNVDKTRYVLPEPEIVRTGTGTVKTVIGSSDFVVEE